MCLLATCLAAAAQQHGGADISRVDMIRLYQDCDETRWPGGTEVRHVPRTPQEIAAGVVRRRALEAAWRERFAGRRGGSPAATPRSAWRYPLEDAGSLLRNYTEPTGSHEALDIFVARPGVEVRAPAAGVVVAAGDGWRGGWTRDGGLWYSGGGLSRNSGNGIILFEPGRGGYFLFSHLREGLLVRPGDVVPAGAPLGRVGPTGSAAQPGHGRHLHIAYKEPGRDCGAQGVLVAQNPFQWLSAARSRERRSLDQALVARHPPQPTRFGDRAGGGR